MNSPPTLQLTWATPWTKTGDLEKGSKLHMSNGSFWRWCTIESLASLEHARQSQYIQINNHLEPFHRSWHLSPKHHLSWTSPVRTGLWLECFISLTPAQVFYGDDENAKAKLVDDVRECCLHNGFFQIVGHRVPAEVQNDVLKSLKSFFSLPQSEKEKVHKGELQMAYVKCSRTLTIDQTTPPGTEATRT